MGAVTVEVDASLAQRLRQVADELGARGLPLPVIVTALLVEACESLEAREGCAGAARVLARSAQVT
jgi:hypothetical protein